MIDNLIRIFHLIPKPIIFMVGIIVLLGIGFTDYFTRLELSVSFSSNCAGGVWRPFYNQLDYIKHVPAYDAFSLGHLATAVMAVTVFVDNYPEHKYIRPLGYTLISVFAFQMLNNGVILGK